MRDRCSGYIGSGTRNTNGKCIQKFLGISEMLAYICFI